VDAAALDGGREARELGRVEPERRPEDERQARQLGGDERERDLGDERLLAAQARPERRVDERLDRGRVGQRREPVVAVFLGGGDAACKIIVHARGDIAGGRVGQVAHAGYAGRRVGAHLSWRMVLSGGDERRRWRACGGRHRQRHDSRFVPSTTPYGQARACSHEMAGSRRARTSRAWGAAIAAWGSPAARPDSPSPD
jgi:hypothetical protein